MSRLLSTESLAGAAWRLAAQHPRLPEFSEGLRPLLGASAHLAIRRLDAAERTLEIVADIGVQHTESRRTQFSPEPWSGLLELLGREAIWVGEQSDLERLCHGLSPTSWRGPLALTALRQAGQVIGVLLIAMRDAEALAVALREPCGAALANDIRWRELASGREAAEAERQALLLRLKRQDISDSIVGVDAGLSEVMRAVERVARTETPVLVLGETGTARRSSRAPCTSVRAAPPGPSCG